MIVLGLTAVLTSCAPNYALEPVCCGVVFPDGAFESSASALVAQAAPIRPASTSDRLSGMVDETNKSNGPVKL